MERFVTTYTEHRGYVGDEIEPIWVPKDYIPERYRFLREFYHQCKDYHIHVGLYELIPPPLPTIEEAAIALVAGWEKRFVHTDNGKALIGAVERKLEEDD